MQEEGRGGEGEGSEVGRDVSSRKGQLQAVGAQESRREQAVAVDDDAYLWEKAVGRRVGSMRILRSHNLRQISEVRDIKRK